MFALGDPEFGMIFEKFFKKYFRDGKSAVIISKSFFILHKLTAELPSQTFSDNKNALSKNREGKKVLFYQDPIFLVDYYRSEP